MLEEVGRHPARVVEITGGEPLIHPNTFRLATDLADHVEDGLEVAHDVFESDASVVFDQAENRMHAQDAILLKICGKA